MGQAGDNVDVAGILAGLSQSAELHDGALAADWFTEDGVYHDVFYGEFRGRDGILRLTEVIHTAGADYRWDFHEPVTDGETLYARYTFSYRSTLPEARGRRAMFEGVSIMKLRDGKIAEYREIAVTEPALVEMNFTPERIAKICARKGAALKARPEMQRHLAD
jgi:hypothetical protein